MMIEKLTFFSFADEEVSVTVSQNSRGGAFLKNKVNDFL